MSEAEKQEGQKTVVAFIAGLLIGGLLVWVFSSSPEAPVEKETSDETTTSLDTKPTTETDKTTDTDTESVSTVASTVEPREETVVSAAPRPTVSADRDGGVVVTNQAAGNVVALESVTTPTTQGWVVVRDFENGVAGRILGAARFNEAEGLMPNAVNLLRATEAGKNYQVVFFNDNGDKVFDLDDDAEITGVSTSFKAE